MKPIEEEVINVEAEERGDDYIDILLVSAEVLTSIASVAVGLFGK